MEREPTTYQAFVSYRHAEVDSAVARDVQRGLERFRVPAPTSEELGLKRIAPVFRDKEELAVSPTLGDEIEAALERSSALVVVCSPRTSESQWVDREIEAYLRAHDRSRVFTVLAEGEPFEVIPERLLFEDVGGERRALEPLSCDFRSPKRGDRRVELVRLAAAVLGVGFDSLMQRDRRRRARVAAVAAAVAFALVASVAGYALWSNARISESYEQSVLRRAQLLATQAEQQIDAGDRLAAIELASEAVPARGEGRPVQPQVMRALARATCAYETGYVGDFSPSARLVAKYDVGGQMAAAGVSPNQRYLATATQGGDIRVWDVASAEMLFQTRFGDGYYRSDVVVTDDGCVIASDSYDTVTCWDARSQKQKWTCGKPEQIENSGVFGPFYERFYLDDTGEFLIALGEKKAYKLDAATGAVVALCEYGLGENEHVSFLGGIDDERAFACKDGKIVACLTVKTKNEDDTSDRLCLVDFASGKAHMLPARYGRVHSIQLIDNNDALISHSERDDYTKGRTRRYYPNSFSQMSYARHVERIDLSSGESRWKARVPLWATSFSDSLQVMQDVEAQFVSGEALRRVVAYCTSNVCEVLDLGSGASLAHFEASSPIVVAWPYSKENKTYGMRGFLLDGRDMGAAFLSGKLSSDTDQCVDACLGWRLKDATLLVSEDKDMLYLYADSLADEPLATLPGVGGGSLSTKRGIVCVQYSNAEDGGQEQTMTIRLLDCEKRCVAWERSIAASKEASLDVVGYSEEHGELYITKRERTDKSAKACVVYTVSLENGEVQEWDASMDSKEWDGTDPYISEYATYTSGVGADFGEDNKIIVTDLHERTSEVVPAEALGIDPKKYHSSGDVRISPDKSMLVVPNDESESNGEARGYSLYRPKDGSVKKLSVPLARSQTKLITWSSDQTRFVALGVDSLMAYDESGNELLNIPLAVRDLGGFHFAGDRLLMVCNEGPMTVLLSYALDGSAAEQRCVLEEGNGAGGGGDPLYSAQWVDASQGRDLTRDPGDLFVKLSNENVFLVDVASLQVCQQIEGCLGYDQQSGIFVVQEGGSEYNVCLYDRRAADELVERGRAQVGNSAMGSEKRLEFGLQ